MSKLPILEILAKYENLNQQMGQTSDTEQLIKLSREQKRLQPQYELAGKILHAEKGIAENQSLLTELEASEVELIELTKEDINNMSQQLEAAESELLSYLSPSDPRDEYGIYVEIRAGAGGDESSLFAAELARMYQRLSEELGFNFKISSSSDNPIGGYKEVICEVRGDGAYGWFKYESGVHRVQRVPATEKQGRIHTSTVAVAIMPLLEGDNSEFKLDSKDVEIIVSTSSGKGGQSVNTTYSAVKMRHIPTGIEAQSQDERSQVQNRIKALSVLTSRVFDFYEQQRLEKEAAERKSQVGRMDRSEKIRTYNFPQDRLTDHRYGQNWNQLPNILNGTIIDVIRTIKRIEAEQALETLQV